MNNTISTKIKQRLLAQAEEATSNNMVKLANTIQAQVIDSQVRSDDTNYSYSYAEMEKDVENLLWKAAVRVQDYYAKTADIAETDDVVTKTAEELIGAVKKSMGKVGIVGPFEPKLPGEQ